MYKTDSIEIKCKECGNTHSTIPVYEYRYNSQVKHDIPIQWQTSKNWSGSEEIQLTDNRWKNYYAIIHKKATDKYFVEYENKFHGFLVEGKTEVTINFDSITCESCRKKLGKDRKAFINKFEKLIKKELEKKDYQIWCGYLDNGYRFEFSPISRTLDNFGCLWLGYTILGGGSIHCIKVLEAAVEKLFKEKLKVNFEFVYSYSESLNPDRDGVYCMIRPLSFIEEESKSKKKKTVLTKSK